MLISHQAVLIGIQGEQVLVQKLARLAHRYIDSNKILRKYDYLTEIMTNFSFWHGLFFKSRLLQQSLQIASTCGKELHARVT